MTTAEEAPPLLVRLEAGALWLTMNRPQALNAFTVPIMEALSRELKRASKDSSVRAVAVAGSGKAFCVGQDLKEHLSRRPSFLKDLKERYNPLVLAVRSLEKPVVAVVQGPAAGAGMSLALACDFRICSEEASFHTSFSKIGLTADSGNLFFLERSIGASRALELAMTGRPVPAREAEAWGLVHRVVPAERLDQEAREFVGALVAGPSRAQALTKRLFNEVLFARDLPSLLEQEAYFQEIAGRTQDHAEGLRAFLEKRPARFTGR